MDRDEKPVVAQWLTNSWYCAMFGDALPVGAVDARMLLDQAIVLWRGQDGEVHAIEDRCPHRYAPLSLGRQIGKDRIRCGYHGLEFDGAGRCAYNPHGKGRIPASAGLRSYPVREYGGIVWLWMGQGEPDATSIPDLSIFMDGSPYQVGKKGWLTLDVPFELVVDNLLDLSHAALLHDGVLGNEQSIFGETSFREENEAVLAERFMPNINPPEYFDLIFKADGRPIDMWHDIRWSAPASLLLDVGSTTQGAGKQAGTSVVAMHLITPVAANQCMYHFLSARRNPPERPAEEDERIQARLAELRVMAFSKQDGPMIAAQQRVIERVGHFRPMLLPSIDKGVALWRRRHEAMLKAETQTVAREKVIA